MLENKGPFDTSSKIHLPYRTPEGKVDLVVHFPNDNQWIERGRLTRIIAKRGGRGSTENEVFPNSEADLKLYYEIKLPDAPEITPPDATRIMDALGFCEVRDTALGSDQATVIMGIVGGKEVTFKLQIPTAEQVIQFRKRLQRGARELPNGKYEYRVMLEPGAQLFNLCQGASPDYANGIPANHKSLAARTVVDELDREMQAGAGDDLDAF